MLFALTTGHELGLGLMAVAFIVFSLVSALWLPRVRPGFPGRNLPAFLITTVVFFAAMLFAIAYFGRESKPAESAAATGATTTAAQTTTAAAQTTTTAASAATLAAGKAVFLSAGCSACHTLKDAGTTGTIGPDLDKLPRYAKQAGQPLAAFVRQSIVDPSAYIQPGYQDLMPKTFKSSIPPAKLSALVQYLVTESSAS